MVLYTYFLFPGPLLMVIEYAKFGNLRQFLRDRRPTHGEFIDTSTEEDSSADGEKRPSEEAITLSDLVSFAFQIARGMEYLESNKVSSLRRSPCQIVEGFSELLHISIVSVCSSRFGRKKYSCFRRQSFKSC